MPALTPMRRRAVDRLLVHYLELPDEAQTEFLDRCRRKLPRLALWLDELVNSQQTVTLLDDSVNQVAGEAARSRSADAPVLKLADGTRLGPWTVASEVGRGGMGRVYRGQRADGAFEMEVAVKLIGRRRAGLGELLRRECRLLARLDHPSITRLVDAGLDDCAGPFLVMEWVEGTDLTDWLAERPPDLPTRLDLFEQIVEAVSHAHQRLIIHGDIKPDNVRIRDDGVVKLMDFGVARLLEPDNADGGDVRALTPAFAAPEQLHGETVTARSDLWSLGALLHWLLCGQTLPRQADQVRTALAGCGWPRSRELAAIIGKATATHPDSRYRTVAELLDDLRAWRSHHPVSAMPSTRRYRTGKFLRRNPLLIGGVAALFAVLAIGMVTSLAMYFEAEQARQQALFERDRAEQHAREVEQVVDFQAEQLTGIDTSAMAADLRQQLREFETGTLEQADLTGIMLGLIDEHILDPSQTAIDHHFDDQPLVRSRLLASLAGTRRGLALYESAEATLETAMALLDGEVEDTNPARLAALHQKGLLLAERGDRAAAAGYLRQALDGRQRVLGPDHRDTLTSARQLGVLLQSMGRIDEAETLYRSTLERRREALGDDHPDTIASVLDMGVLALEQGRLEDAEDRFRQALKARRQVLGSNHPSTLTSMANLGVLLRRQGRHEEAEQYYTEALERRRTVLGYQHPDTLQSVNNLAVLYQVKGQLDQSETLYREALEGYESILGAEHPHTLNTLANLGVLLEMQDRLEEAETHLRQALAGRMRVHGPEHPATMVSKSTLSALLTRLGRAEAAIEFSREVLAFRRSALGDRHPQTLIAMTHHAAALRELGRVEEAAELSANAVKLAREVLPPDHWRLAQHQAQHGRTLAALSRYDEAEKLLLEARDIMMSGPGDDHVLTVRIMQQLDELYLAWQPSQADHLR